MRSFLPVLALFVLGACVSVEDQRAAVLKRASYDFGCPPANIAVTWLQSGTYGAEGCRQKQVYETQGTQVYKEGAAPYPVYIDPPIRYGLGYDHYYYGRR